MTSPRGGPVPSGGHDAQFGSNPSVSIMPSASGGSGAHLARETLAHGPVGPLAVAALGVVFGDIGTSPLYSIQTAFSIEHNRIAPTPQDVYGVISLVVWSITVIVSIKYVALVMQADNQGEGGILALVALLRRKLRGKRLMALVTTLGIVGAGLFYGDSLITPAISVMSAIEGVTVSDPQLGRLVLPVAVIILTGLFILQRFGSGGVGRGFGPVMAIWFLSIALLGLPHIVRRPDILRALSPSYAVTFWIAHPGIAFVAMAAVVLTITGAEALYADMGHFGPQPIRTAWFVVVFPCLVVNYLGQGSLILQDPGAIGNPFFHLAPAWAQLPMVVLATVATIIASQAVISGAFSVSHQAIRLGLLPRLTVQHTSKKEGGQIYMPTINWILYVGVLLLVAVFQSSVALANAYGLAVTGTLILTTTLFLMLAALVWRWPAWLVAVIACTVGLLELVFFGANLTKIISGGWLPVLIAAMVILIMTTWMRGAEQMRVRRAEMEGPLRPWVEHVRDAGVPRVPGTAIFLHGNPDTVPLALKENLRFNHVLHEQVVIVTVINENVPHIHHVDRVSVNDLGYRDDGIIHMRIRLGFNDSQDVPRGLEWSHGKGAEFEVDPAQARYFVSVLTVLTQDRGIRSWRKRLYIWLTHNASGHISAFRLPPEQTIIMGGTVYI